MDDLIRQEVSLAPYSTLRVGGSAAYLAEVTSIAELQEVLSFAKQHTNVPPLVIGSGSNVLFREAGYPGVVVVVGMTGITQAEEGDSVLITAAAGELLDTVVLHAVQESLWGLENLSAIPGTIGATPVQNVGAYGVEVTGIVPAAEDLASLLFTLWTIGITHHAKHAVLQAFGAVDPAVEHDLAQVVAGGQEPVQAVAGVQAVTHQGVAHAGTQALLVILTANDTGVAGQRTLRVAEPVAVVHVGDVVAAKQTGQIAGAKGAGLCGVLIGLPVTGRAAAVQQWQAGCNGHDCLARAGHQAGSQHAVRYVGYHGDIRIQRTRVAATNER